MASRSAPPAESRTRWLTVKELAERMNISTRAIHRAVAKREIPFQRPLGTSTIRFSPEDVATIEAAAAVPPIPGRAA